MELSLENRHNGVRYDSTPVMCAPQEVGQRGRYSEFRKKAGVGGKMKGRIEAYPAQA